MFPCKIARESCKNYVGPDKVSPDTLRKESLTCLAGGLGASLDGFALPNTLYIYVYMYIYIYV